MCGKTSRSPGLVSAATASSWSASAGSAADKIGPVSTIASIGRAVGSGGSWIRPCRFTQPASFAETAALLDPVGELAIEDLLGIPTERFATAAAGNPDERKPLRLGGRGEVGFDGLADHGRR